MTNEDVRTTACGTTARTPAKKRGKEITAEDVLKVDVETTATESAKR